MIGRVKMLLKYVAGTRWLMHIYAYTRRRANFYELIFSLKNLSIKESALK